MYRIATSFRNIETKNESHFDLKSEVTGRAKIRPGIPNNWRIFESK